MNWDFKGQTVYHMIKRKKSIAGRRKSMAEREEQCAKAHIC